MATMTIKDNQSTTLSAAITLSDRTTSWLVVGVDDHDAAAPAGEACVVQINDGSDTFNVPVPAGQSFGMTGIPGAWRGFSLKVAAAAGTTDILVLEG